MKIRKVFLILLILASLLISNFSSVYSNAFTENDKINLKFDHDCISVLQLKGKDMLKQVAYVCYEDPNTKIRYPAFCVEPENVGIGTGAGNSYDITLSDLNSPILWRMLYKGYVGSNYKDWNLDCDDDLYFATKTAVHCFVDGSTPKGKYEVPKRVGYGDNVTLEEVKLRGAKVLDVAQRIYEYGFNSSDNYIKATVEISKDKNYELTLNNTKYLVQDYKVKANKELSSYDVKISNFPEGTKILNSNNIESKTINNDMFKIAIPEDMINENFDGDINVYNAKVKSYPIFYGSSGNTNTQDYVISSGFEITQAKTTLSIDAYKSSLKIVKTDEEKKPIANVIFNVKYEAGENIGDFKTDKNGVISINNLKQGNVIVTEKKVHEKYILDSVSKNIKLEYNKTSTVNVTNKYKTGKIKVIKVDKDENSIAVDGVEFELYSKESGKVIGTYITDEKGEIYINNLRIGKYSLIEKKTNKWYNLNDEEINVDVEWDKTSNIIIKNEAKKGQVRVIKVDKDNNEIKLKGVEFEVLDENDNILETLVTDKNGEALTKEYPLIDYKE